MRVHTPRDKSTYWHTYIFPPPPLPLFSEAGLAGGDLPLLGGFPGCLINYPTPIVYQEAREEQEKAQNGHCQVGGIHFPGSSAWGVARRGKRKTERPGLWSREERRDREREELTGSWDKMILQAMTVLTIYDPQVAVGDFFRTFFNNLLSSIVYFHSYVTQHWKLIMLDRVDCITLLYYSCPNRTGQYF